MLPIATPCFSHAQVDKEREGERKGEDWRGKVEGKKRERKAEGQM